MKRLLSLSLLLAFVLSLCACGNKSDSLKSIPEEEGIPITETVVEATASLDEDNQIFADSIVSLEKVAYELDGPNLIHIMLQFRNVSDWNLDRLVVVIQFLDKNGDIIDDTFGAAEYIDSGQAAWFTFVDDKYCRNSNSINDVANHLHTIRIVQVQTQSEDVPEQYRFNNAASLPLANFKFNNPIKILTADLELKE